MELSESHRHQEAESVAEEADLLDVNNWDDVRVEPQVGPGGVVPNQALFDGGVPPQSNPYAAAAAAAPYGLDQYPPQHHHHPQAHGQAHMYAPPPATAAPAAYSTAIVPAVTGQPQAYPGAPPPQPWTQTPQYPPQQQQQPGYVPPQVQQPNQAYAFPQQQQQHAYHPPQHAALPPPPNQPVDPWSVQPHHHTQQTYMAPPEY
jgi:hypothetical protein